MCWAHLLPACPFSLSHQSPSVSFTSILLSMYLILYDYMKFRSHKQEKHPTPFFWDWLNSRYCLQLHLAFFANVQNFAIFYSWRKYSECAFCHPYVSCLRLDPEVGGITQLLWLVLQHSLMSMCLRWSDLQPMGSTVHSDLFLVLRNFHLNTSLDSYQQCVRVPFVHIQAFAVSLMTDCLTEVRSLTYIALSSETEQFSLSFLIVHFLKFFAYCRY